MHRLTVFLLCLLCGTLILASNTEAAPLLQEGKRTLYQRVISHPTAQLYAQASDQSQVVDKGLRPFTPLYVYERGQGWLNVGKGTNKADGWIKADLTTPWNQSLTLLFSNRSQRDPVIFFRDTRALQDICDAPDMSERLVSLQLAVAKKKTGPEVVASEPMTSSVDLDRFYLMPILEMQEPYEGTKFLRVASIDPGQIPGSQYHQGKGGTASDPTTKKAPRTGIAIVMDTTVSMQPYIEQSRQLIKTIYDRLQKEKLAEHVGFAFVAFRNSTAAVPELEYVSTVVSDFVTASNRKELESRLAEVREAKVSTHSFNEDSLAGVYNAIESLSWDEYDSRIILLVTDAGPLPSDDRYRSVAMEPQEMADFAGQKGIWIVAVHIKTPAGASNHDYAEQAYRTLSMKNGSAQYQSIKTSNPKEGARYFAAVAESLAKTMEQVVTLTTQGKMLTRPKDAAPKNPEEDAAQLPFPQVLDHALDPGGKQQDLPVSGVLQAGDGGDAVAHGDHMADLLRRHLRRPSLHGLPDQGDHVALAGLQPAQLLLELPQAALGTPVIDGGAYLQQKASGNSIVLFPLQAELPVIGLPQNVQKALPVFLCRRRAAV